MPHAGPAAGERGARPRRVHGAPVRGRRDAHRPRRGPERAPLRDPGRLPGRRRGVDRLPGRPGRRPEARRLPRLARARPRAGRPERLRGDARRRSSTSAAAIPTVVACYAIDEARMYVPGESVRGIPVEYPLTHEYGHHIALLALEQPVGRARLGRQVLVERHAHLHAACAAACSSPATRARTTGTIPARASRTATRTCTTPTQPWYYNELMRPDAKAFAAIRRDVLHPWTGPRSRTFRGRARPAPRHAHLPHPAHARRRPRLPA